MQFKGLGAPQRAFCNANGVCIDRHIACRCRRCIYVCPACGCYETAQRAFQIWKSFCNQDRPFSSSTWSGRLFFCSENFRVCIRSKQVELVPTRKFWIRFFYKSDFKNDCWASPKPDIQYKIAPTAYLNRCWISNFFEKNSFRKNQRCFIQYHIKPELLLPFLNVKSRRNASWKFLLHCDMLSTSHHRTLKITWPSARDTRR